MQFFFQFLCFIQFIEDTCSHTLLLNKSQLSGHLPGGNGEANVELIELLCFSHTNLLEVPQFTSFHKPKNSYIEWTSQDAIVL